MKKIDIFKFLIIISFFILTSYILFFYINNHYKYNDILLEKTNILTYKNDAPRGKIYDRNGKLLVDNVTINNLVFYNLKGIDVKMIANKLSDIISFDSPSEKELINYYKNIYNVNKLLSKEEIEKINYHEIDKDELINNKIKKEIEIFSDKEKNIAKCYSLLNDGYSYDSKIILTDIDDELINKITVLNIPGIKVETSYKRSYPYNEVLRNIFGSVGKINEEEKYEYLNKGYSISDTVGISFLEKYYEDYLKGQKAIYKVNDDYSLTLVKKEEKGNDLYLSIDIDMQIKLEEIVKDNLIKAKKYPNTDYLSDSYVIISNPKTGELLSIIGQRYLDNNTFNDIVINNISSSFTMGSVVKGATISVGYQNGLIDPNEKVYDGCVKLLNQTEKCSWKKLGYLTSVTALEQSSNYYQFLLAIKLTGYKYYPNINLPVTEKEFNTYRKMLASYGLGIKTGIDLPNEKIGLIGSKISPDLLLNLSIGQYDTYTPIELITYINTIADNGKRHKPSLVTKIKNKEKIIYENKYAIEEKVDIKNEDMKLIQEGFYFVMNRGTGLGFMNRNLKPAGKTGTSESFFDSNNDGTIDTSTLTLTLAGYFPYDNPKYSMVIISPNAAYRNEKYDYIYYITSRISQDITNYMYDNNMIKKI